MRFPLNGLALWLLVSLTPAAAQPAAATAPSAALSPAQPAEPAAPDLGTITIRGRRAEAQGSQHSLSGTEAALVPGAGSDSIKALQSLPGVVAANDGSGEPAVRGSRPTDNAYLVDFVPVGYLFHVGGLVSVLPGELVQRFDLHSAAFGPQFADVTGAVLEVGLRDPANDRLRGSVDASFLAASVVAEGPLAPGHSLLVAARRSYLDWLVGDLEDENSGMVMQMPRYHDYQLKYLWEPNTRQRISLHLSGASDAMRYRIPPGSVLSEQDPVFTGDGHDDVGYGTQALQWESSDGEGFDNRIAAGMTRTRMDSRTGTAVDLSAQVRTSFVRELAHWRLSPEQEWWLGGSVHRTRVALDLDLRNPSCTEFEPDCDFTSADPQQIRQHLNFDGQDVHLRNRWQFHPDWALSTGLRHSRDLYLRQQHTEPRLGLEWAYSPSTRFSAAWGQHHQQPGAVQMLPELGNPQLRHLRARHRMLGMDQRLQGGWSWRAEVYDKQLDQLVIADPLRQYVNGGSGRAWGAELLLRKDADGQPHDALGRVSGWLSLSWARSLRHNDSTGERFDFEFDQPLVLHLVARWKRDDQMSFGAKWTLHSGSLITPITGSYVDADGRVRPVYGPLNSERLPSYHRLDLRADYRFSPRLSGYLELINAYNRANISGYAYSADYSQRSAETQLPLLTSLGVHWTF